MHARGDHVIIDFIEVAERGNGRGAAVMNSITTLTDKMGISLEVEPVSYRGHPGYDDALPQDDLEAWYVSLGFDYVQGDNRMVRELQIT